MLDDSASFFSDIPHWPPSPSMETLLMFNEEEVLYDLNKAIQVAKKRPGTKKAAHCVLYSQKSKGDYRILVRSDSSILRYY